MKQLALAFIILGLFATTLDNVFAPGLEAFRADRARDIHDLFQTVVRTAFAILGALLMFKLYKTNNALRRRSIGTLTIVMIGLFAILPLLTGFYDVLFIWMPFPWTTFPLQLLYDGHFLAESYSGLFGGNGVQVILGIYVVWQILLYTLVALKGKRIYCSMLCAHAGVHAETLSEALPLIGDFSKGRHHLSKYYKSIWMLLKTLLFGLNLGLILAWILLLLGVKWLDPSLLRIIEGVKLIGLEFMLFYIWMLGATARGYCFYCPAGSTLSLWASAFGHTLKTDAQVCVTCGVCDANCEMGIKIMAKAKKQKPVRSGLCVGCGHCVDGCPTKTLYLGKHKA